MADNDFTAAEATTGTTREIAGDDISSVFYQRVKIVWGADGTASDASTAAPLPVVQTGALPAGSAAIGKLAANSGVDIGDVDITSIAAGDNNIGNVDIVTLPALPAGTNNIGDVDVLTVPADPFGVNADAGSATGSISAKLRFIAATGIPITGTVTVGSHAVTNAGTFATQSTLQAGAAHVGQVKTPIQYVTLTMTTPTGALAAGDVYAATQIVAACTQANDVNAMLHSVTLIDVDDQKAALTLVFFDANTTLGTEDAAPDIDDTEAQTVIGFVEIATGDYKDLGVNSVVNLKNIGLTVHPASGTDDIYMAIYGHSTSTPTYASGTIYVRLGFI